MKWVWQHVGIVGMFVTFAIILMRTAQEVGILSLSFFYSPVDNISDTGCIEE
jgi:hypothetical protein